MTSREPLTGSALSEAMVGLEGWTVEEGSLHKEFAFDDFVGAFGFMAAAALCAERRNHHPNWSNVYNRVTVDLSTHDVDAITMFDIELARDLEAISRPASAP